MHHYNIINSTISIIYLIAILILFLNPATAITEIEVNPINSPDGIILLIVDGLGSNYICPASIPYAIDGTRLPQPKTSNISLIIEDNMQIKTVTTQKTYTGGGHSILVTGYSNANTNAVKIYDATIYDMTRNNNFIDFAILQRGDFYEMRNEQHLIIYDASNSINNPELKIDKNYGFKASTILYSILNSHKNEKQNYIHSYPESSIERYNAYNRAGIKIAKDIINYMSENHINQRYMLTINLGATDSAGHFRGVKGYIESIEALDKIIMSLYNLANENNLVFILIADYGMAFRKSDSMRGGHQGPDFTVTDEAQKIPFVISAPTIESGVLKGNFGQEDIAPTLLDLLDIRGKLKLQDGSALPIENFISIKLSGLSMNNRVELMQNGKIIAFGEYDSEYIFYGVKPDFNYVLSITESGSTTEKQIFTDTDISFDFSKNNAYVANENNFLDSFNFKNIIGFLLILIINIIGFVLIFKIIKQ